LQCFFGVHVSALYNRMDCTVVWYSLVFTLLLMFFAFYMLCRLLTIPAARPTFCRCPCYLTRHLRLFLLDTQSLMQLTSMKIHTERLSVWIYTGLLFWHCLFLAHIWKWLRRLCWRIADYIQT